MINQTSSKFNTLLFKGHHQWRKKASHWLEKISAKAVPHEGFVPGIFKELLILHNKKKNNPSKWVKDVKRPFTTENIEIITKHLKRYSVSGSHKSRPQWSPSPPPQTVFTPAHPRQDSSPTTYWKFCSCWDSYVSKCLFLCTRASFSRIPRSCSLLLSWNIFFSKLFFLLTTTQLLHWRVKSCSLLLTWHSA